MKNADPSTEAFVAGWVKQLTQRTRKSHRLVLLDPSKDSQGEMAKKKLDT